MCYQEQGVHEDKIADFVPLKLADGGADTGIWHMDDDYFIEMGPDWNILKII